ncbi:hypothetical protein PFISCL1PPCAC_2144, partial [Pristionchus fissidentatus]
SSIFFFSLLLIVAIDARMMKRSMSPNKEITRCGISFLNLAMPIDQEIHNHPSICNRIRRSPIWFGDEPETESQLQRYCCKLGCNDLHITRYLCNKKQSSFSV